MRGLGWILIVIAPAVFSLTFAADFFVRREIGKITLEFVDRFIKIGDFREVALVLNTRLGTTFSAVALSDLSGNEIFQIPPEHKFASNFQWKITLESVDSQKILTFWYSLNLALVLSIFASVAISMLLVIWSRVKEQRIRVAAFMERKIEVANLLAQVSHDIRSPLSAISLAASSLKAEDGPRKEMILGASKRITQIAESLLQQTRLDLSAQAPTNIVDICKQIINEKRIEHTGIKIEEDFSKSSIIAIINSNDLARVISNLLNNSIQAGASKIQVVVRQDRESILTIKDNGPGISKKVLRRLGKEPISEAASRVWWKLARG
jgi:signal transduction histidine kinase